MLKKTITYEDFNGQSVTEDHYFHLSKAELVEMEVSYDEGLAKALEKIVEEAKPQKIIETMKNLILDSYGQKSADGRRFNKSPIIREEFAMSEAYSTLFMELVTNAQSAAEFVNGIIPKGLEEETAKMVQAQNEEKMPEFRGFPPPQKEHPSDSAAKPAGPRVISVAEAREMDHNQLAHLLTSGEAILGNSSEG